MKKIYKKPLFYINILLLMVAIAIITSVNAAQFKDSSLVKKVMAAVQTITGEGTLNKIASFAGANTIGDSQIFDNGTNVGIGTTDPKVKLHIKGGGVGIQTPYGNTSGIAILSGDLDANLLPTANTNSYWHIYAPFWQGPVGSFGIGDAKAGQQRLVILANGNVGIGTTIPNAKLEISASNSTVKLGDGIRNANDNGLNIKSSSGNSIISVDSPGLTGFLTANNGILSSSYLYDPTSKNIFLSTSAGSNAGMAFAPNGTISIYIAPNGNVGIGTTNPDTTAKATIEGSVANNIAALKWRPNDSNVSAVGFLGFGSKTDYGTQADNVLIGATNSSNANLMFRTVNTTQMTITNTGNVGIGTVSPSEKLQVNGGNIKIGTADKGIIFYGGGEKIIGTSGYGIDFQTSNGTSRMTILSNGNVGIGTTNPTQKLDVGSGNVSANDYWIGAANKWASQAFSLSGYSVPVGGGQEVWRKTVGTMQVDKCSAWGAASCSLNGFVDGFVNCNSGLTKISAGEAFTNDWGTGNVYGSRIILCLKSI